MDKVIKPVVWSKRATKDLGEITEFYIQLYGVTKTRIIVTEIRKSTEILERNDIDASKIGALDKQFSHLKYTYRKLNNGYCKITYRESKTNIYIVRVFDTRQNPTKNK